MTKTTASTRYRRVLSRSLAHLAGIVTATIMLAALASPVASQDVTPDGAAIAAVDDASLIGLTFIGHPLTPAFSPGIHAYRIETPTTEATVSFQAWSSDPAATVMFGGNPMPAGATLFFGLAMGSNTIRFDVTAPDGQTRLAYSVTVTRIAPDAPQPGEFGLIPASGTTLPDAVIGEQYRFRFSTRGGTGNVRYSFVGSAGLPNMGLINDTLSSFGRLTAGRYAFTLRATDGNGEVAEARYVLNVVPPSTKVADQQVEFEPGSAPPRVDLTAGARGGPFTAAEIVSLAPANAGRIQMDGMLLAFTPDPAFAGVAKVGFRVTGAYGLSNIGTITYAVGPDTAGISQDIHDSAAAFIQSRQGLLASSIETPSLMTRRNMAGAADAITSDLSPAGNGLAFALGTSLARLNAAADAARGLATADQPPAPFDVWMDGRFKLLNQSDTEHRWGNFGMISVGADYLVNDHLLLGLSLHGDTLHDPLSGDETGSGSGWLAGPYASLELGDGVFLDARLLYGTSTNEIATPFWHGDFDTRRLMLDAALAGQWQLDPATTLTPRLRAVYLGEDVFDHVVENTSGTGVPIAGFITEQFRLSLGADLAHTFELDNGLIVTPSLGLTAGLADLDTAGAFGQLSAGAALRLPAGWTLQGDLQLDLDHNGPTALGARARLSAGF